MPTFKFNKIKLLLGSLAVLAAASAMPSPAMINMESATDIGTQAENTDQNANRLALTNGNVGMLRKLLDAADDLDMNHKSKRCVLFFFGLPANIHLVSAELDKLAKQYGDKLTIVTVDPAYLSAADEIQKAWVQGDPAYPTAVFVGNGVLLNDRGAISNASLEALAAEGMNWDYSLNHKGSDD